MKRKVIAMMMGLTLALAVTACGGSDTDADTADTAVEETVDDTEEADDAEVVEEAAEEDASEEDTEDLGPLYTIEAVEAPELAGTTWHFTGAMLDGEELDSETATGVLEQNYGGTLDMVFDEDGNATMEQGGGSMTGTYEYADANTVLINLDNSGSEINYAAGFAENGDDLVMVLMIDDRGYDGIYFVQ